jgi:hypothetical protein
MVRNARRIGAIVTGVALLLGGCYLASAALAAWHVPAPDVLDPVHLEKRAEVAIAVWQQLAESDDEPLNADNAEPTDAHDGLYVGMVTMRAEGRIVTIKLKVTNGVGAGTQSQRECGVAPVALKISSTGNVTGLALMFSSTCLKSEMAIRGRAIGGMLQLRLGNQYLELSKPND